MQTLSRTVTTIVSVMVLATLGGGAVAGSAVGDVSARRSQEHITWNGWKGVAPGTNLEKAAKKTGGSLDKSCEVYWYLNAGSGVYMTDNLSQTRKADWIYSRDGHVRGPLGVHDGMKFPALKRKAKKAELRIRKFYVDEAQSYYRWIKNPHNGTAIAAYVDDQKPARITWIGLMRNAKMAKKAMLYQGGC